MVPQLATGVRVELDVPAVMRDGVILRANVYRPDDGGAGRYPVLLTRLPYGKDLPLGSSTLDPVQAARRGYVVVVQDVRGTWTSEGEWMPFLYESDDGEDSVAWASQLPGANGAVGMYGASYFGFTQWAAAKRRPSALRAIAPMITWDDPNRGVVTRGGVRELGLGMSWTMQQGFNQLMRRHQGDPRTLGAAISQLAQEMNRLPGDGYRELPLERFGPLARSGLDEPMNRTIREAGDEAVEDELRSTPAYTYELPTLHVGGWYDLYLQGTLRNFQGMRSHGHPHQQLLIGPWTHGNMSHIQGDLDFGMGAWGAMVDLRSDLMTMQLLFFDHYLKGAANGYDATPPVTYFVMGANVWKTSDRWPPAAITEQAWYLHSTGDAQAGDGGVLSRQPPGQELSDIYRYDPADPVPTIGGSTLMHPVFRAGPVDQRPIESRPDVLVYTSEPLQRPLELTGPVRAVLHVASDAPDADFVARLVDVHPTGAAITVTDGVIRTRYRNGLHSEAAPLAPGETYQIEIDLWETSIVVQPGHRLRLHVTSSNFPRWERNLNTGADSSRTTEMQVARQTVLHDDAHPSYLLLPVVSE
jgi:putative CocE/NonD family hydrolase